MHREQNIMIENDYIDSRENKLVSYTEYRLDTTKSSPAKHFG